MVACGPGEFSKTLARIKLLLNSRWDLLDDSRKYFFHIQASSSGNQDGLSRIKLKGIPYLFQSSLRLG